MSAESPNPIESTQSLIEGIVASRARAASGELEPSVMAQQVLGRADILRQQGMLNNPDISPYLQFIAKDPAVWGGLVARIIENRTIVQETPDPTLDKKIKDDLELAEGLGLGTNDEIFPYLQYLRGIYPKVAHDDRPASIPEERQRAEEVSQRVRQMGELLRMFENHGEDEILGSDDLKARVDLLVPQIVASLAKDNLDDALDYFLGLYPHVRMREYGALAQALGPQAFKDFSAKYQEAQVGGKGNGRTKPGNEWVEGLQKAKLGAPAEPASAVEPVTQTSTAVEPSVTIEPGLVSAEAPISEVGGIDGIPVLRDDLLSRDPWANDLPVAPVEVLPEEKREQVQSIMDELRKAYEGGGSLHSNELEAELSDVLELDESERPPGFGASLDHQNSRVYFFGVLDKDERTDTLEEASGLLRQLYSGSTTEVREQLEELLKNYKLDRDKATRVYGQLNIQMDIAAGVNREDRYKIGRQYRDSREQFRQAILSGDLEKCIEAFKQNNRAIRLLEDNSDSEEKQVSAYEKELAAKAGLEIVYDSYHYPKIRKLNTTQS